MQYLVENKERLKPECETKHFSVTQPSELMKTCNDMISNFHMV
jgi:hypothetical protein